MATPAMMRVENGPQFRAALKRTEYGLEHLKETHLKMSGIVAGTAKANAPELTGRTESSVRPGATQRASIVRAGKASLPYVPRDHWGDPPSKGGVKANPWLAAAAKETEPKWFAVYEHDIERLLDQTYGATG